MAVDLKSTSLFSRTSILIEADCLIQLDHERTKDRIRKIMFDRVQQVIVWRTIPGIRITIVLLTTFIPALLLFFVNNIAATVIACFLLLVALIVVPGYFYCGKTTIRVVRAGKTDDIRGVFRPAKINRLISKLELGIRSVQSVSTSNAVGVTITPKA